MTLKEAVKFFNYGDNKNWYVGANKIVNAILDKDFIRHAYLNMYKIEKYTYYMVTADSDIYYDILKVVKDKKFKDDSEALRYFEKLNDILNITIYRLEAIDEKLYK